MGLTTARSIDVHAHAVLEQSMGAAGRYGPELGTSDDGEPWLRIGDYKINGIRYLDSPFMDVELRMRRMQESGIDYQVLSPNPLTYFHFIERQVAIDFCSAHNDALADIVRPKSDQLGALAAVPIQDPVAACEELERSITELGMLGSAISTDMPFNVDSPELDKFYDRCVQLNVPLFIHPAPAGLDGPNGDPRLNEFDLDIMLGFAAQETLTIAKLIIGGVLDRHPSLDICVSHGGGSIAMLAERLADGTRRRPWSPQFLREDGAFESMLSKIWVDNHVHDPNVLPMLEQRVGPEHIVLGTNFAGWDQPLSVDPDSEYVRKLADNARRLLRAE